MSATVADKRHSLQALFSQANQARFSGNCDLAKELYGKILTIKPDSAAAFHELGLMMIEKGQPEIACQLLKQAIKHYSKDADYFFHLGEALVACGKCNEAVVYYKKALEMEATEADYYFGLGNAYTQTQNYIAAVDAYQCATQLNPKDYQAFNNLGNSFFEIGQNKQSLNQYKKALDICPEYGQAHLNLSLSLKLEGRFKRSLYHAQQAVKIEPDNIECVLALADILFGLEKYKQSKTYYFCALKLDKHNQRALRGCARSLMQTADVFDALHYFEQALHLSSGNNNLIIDMASCLIRLQKYSQAKSILETLLAKNSGNSHALFNYGLCLQAEGEFTSALIAHKTCWKKNPELTQSVYHIACNGRYEINDSDISKMKNLLADSKTEIDNKIHLNFALAKVFEQQSEFELAFNYYKQANSLKAEKYPFNISTHREYIGRIKNVFNKHYFLKRRGYGINDKRLTFIVGMPRSGSTLIEQILASHPSVHALGEHMAMPVLVKTLPDILGCMEKMPECANQIDNEASIRLAQQYLDYTNIEPSNAQVVTDKMLGNFLRLGLIALLFPNARVIHCQRDPLDTCVSCYTQDFAHGLRFSTSLENLGMFYNSYVDLMQHWHENLPLDVIDIQYEQLVADGQNNIRKILTFCGLDWNSGCLDFHKTKRPVATASFWQVKQPLYSDSIGRYKHYKKFLDPLVNAFS